jgi:FkbM family methyltransferase
MVWARIIKRLFRQLGYEIRRIEYVDNAHIEFTQDKYELNFREVTIDDSKYFVPTYAMHRPEVKSICEGKLFEPNTHKLIETLCLQKAGSIVHAGAFFGDMLPNFSKFVNGSVYAFEPVLENFILAKLSVDINELSNVILLNSALSANISNLRINTFEKGDLHAGGASSISEHGQICASFKIDSLKALDIILIQLDVEGHELEALSGAKETIARCRPVIAIEDNNNCCKGFLTTYNYSMVRKIPGLEIWAPEEDTNIIEVIKSF